ncbi:hypothetical protein NEOLEDRAFT_1143671 [Neolentinus lepideus HHB14362 ss-1]|uniref:Uncharacterized protein n=1 Tax=Neolentinus lepideus HHB14362 ss-1 TaxID=1314782 RepID=A0A165MED2_9AGAM|nr:hypothetical protein NEOLEDRAFT_1143671 [Neolentinus lepideus HHB14362 ss-1]
MIHLYLAPIFDTVSRRSAERLRRQRSKLIRAELSGPAEIEAPVQESTCMMNLGGKKGTHPVSNGLRF